MQTTQRKFESHQILSVFEPTSEEEIHKIVMSFSNKSNVLDPLPTWLLKKCSDVLIPFITAVVNMSITSGHMPNELKKAVLTPLIKKLFLDPDVLNHFRPISNLSFLSKLIEKVVAVRLNKHMIANGLNDVYQSSYTKLHSTETALTCVLDDIIRGIDDKKCVILLMLDLSAAFDTVDHSILLTRMESMLGIKGTALMWFKSYLSSRSQRVCIDGIYSKATAITCGVPQGSVLGPLLFNIYTLPLANLLKSHNINYHLYADDSQKYAIFELKDYETTVARMESLVIDIRSWYNYNMLKCNDTKTEVLLISSKYKPISDSIPIKVGECFIDPSKKVRNLGVTIDEHLSMESHVNNVVKSAFHKLREIAYFRKYLTTDAAKTLIHAYVTSRVDYCNGLLFGLPNNLLHKLQSVLNTAARVVTMTRKFDSITPVLKNLHWLPVKFRVQFKVLLIVFKCLNGQAPVYLCNKLRIKPPNHLRSSDGKILVVPASRIKLYGDRCFSVAGPKLWNALPKNLRNCSDIDTFKRMLKTHLFKMAFER